MATVSIVIRALNESEHLPGLNNGVARQTRQSEQAVLVYSGSTDASVEISDAVGAHIVHVAPEDFSFGRVLNVGFAEVMAHGEPLASHSSHGDKVPACANPGGAYRIGTSRASLAAAITGHWNGEVRIRRGPSPSSFGRSASIPTVHPPSAQWM